MYVTYMRCTELSMYLSMFTQGIRLLMLTGQW